jgi:hypothetical protein
MLARVAMARPSALFEAYNICGRRGWEGDLMAVGACSKGKVICPSFRGARSASFDAITHQRIHRAARSVAKWIPGSMLRIAPE